MPIAEIILQHHERIDGSGYPFEAMISHRPYRPALGLEATLDELISQRGIRYDAEVVDAVVRLIKDKGYQIPE